MKTSATILICHRNDQSDQKKILQKYLLRKYQLKIFPSPQIHLVNQNQETLTIEMVREIKHQASFASYQKGDRFFCFLAADKATVPAQNALLKLIEEPPSNSHCLLVVNNLSSLLPTIQSRCLIEHIKPGDTKLSEAVANEFLKQFFIDPQKYSYSQIIDWAQQYKDREQAQKVIEQTLMAIIKQPYIQSQSQLLALQALQQILSDLKQNFNVRLCLEDSLFSAKKPLK